MRLLLRRCVVTQESAVLIYFAAEAEITYFTFIFLVDLTLTLILPTSTKWWAPASARKWQMGFNSAFNPYPANVDKMVAPASASKWQMGFNLAFKGLKG
jgi:hypothetical protein